LDSYRQRFERKVKEPASGGVYRYGTKPVKEKIYFYVNSNTK